MVNQQIQYGYRQTVARLIKQQRYMEELIEKPKVKETKWFQTLGDTQDERFQKALLELKKRFGVYAERDADFIVTSMTCGDKDEAALIVNEMVDLFIKSQTIMKKGEVSRKLRALEGK